MASVEFASNELLQKIKSKQALVGVVGLGYVGLPLIHAFIESGFKTIGFDIDEDKIHALKSGQSYINHINSDWIRLCIESGNFEPTSEMDRLAEADTILVCVPTPLSETRDPDLRFIEETTKTIAKSLRPGQLIVLESTTYPGTTREVMLPILESTGLKCEMDFYLAYSPEREDPGNPDFSANRIPKVVGGIDEMSLQIANVLYSLAVVQTVPVSSCEVAEACKILENTYRSVNIAMVNELKVVFQKLDIDIWEVIDAAKTKPFGFQPFYPGPGLGGHCIPIDPFYLSWLARKNEIATRFIELAGEINTSMPNYVIERVNAALNSQQKSINGSSIGIIGVAYKKDVDDPRESPSFKLMEILLDRGAKLSYHDPFVPKLPKMRGYDLPQLKNQDLNAGYLKSLDCVLIATDHSKVDYELISNEASLIVDARNATSHFRAGSQKIWMA